MKTYADVKRALAESPVTWDLMDDVDDDSPLPEFPVTAQDVPLAKRRSTSRKKLREEILKDPPGDPSLLYAAFRLGLIEHEEAQNILNMQWGDTFRLEDFAPKDEEQ